MIVRVTHNQIFKSACRRLAFPVNVDARAHGLAAHLITHFAWRELAGPRTPGHVLTLVQLERILHALPCFSSELRGWNLLLAHLRTCLEKLDAPADEPIAIQMPGMNGKSIVPEVDTVAVMDVIAQDPHRFELHWRDAYADARRP